jgi:alkaline phosphatase D
MKSIYSTLFVLVCTVATAQSTFRIAIGSCSNQENPEQLWEEVVANHPDLWIWGGDNMYGDTQNLQELTGDYEKQKNRPSYQKLLASCPVTGTWDDHDYGINDGGKYFSIKAESKKLAANFLGFAPDNEVWKHEGLYNSTMLKKGKASVKIINLDTRYFRDTVYKEFLFDSVSKKKISFYAVNPDGDILGEEQWTWLEKELKTSTANLILINSSIQLVSQEHRFEKWANFPKAQQRFYNLLARYPSKKVIIISGDRHIAELSKREFTNLPYPLYDFTCSGLTHTWSEVWEESNRYRLGKLVIEKNFGILDIVIQKKSIGITFSVLGKNNIVYQKIEAGL